MEEMINNEFEEFQKQLKIRDKKLKEVVHFNADDKLDGVMDELMDKKMTL